MVVSIRDSELRHFPCAPGSRACLFEEMLSSEFHRFGYLTKITSLLAVTNLRNFEKHVLHTATASCALYQR